MNKEKKKNDLMKNNSILKSVLFLLVSLCSWTALGQNTTGVQNTSESNEKLLQQYIQSKGAGIITFDASNIKQFWTERSIISKDNSFDVLLTSDQNEFKSNPLKLQLANVNESQDCKIEIIASTSDFDFSVLNNKLKTISSSSSEEKFMHYSIKSSTFHLEDTKNISFFITFTSKTEIVSIKHIILSFFQNKDSSFLVHPGLLNIIENDDYTTDATSKKKDGLGHSLTASGKWFGIRSKKKIILDDNELTNSVTIKNIGENPTDIYFGYIPYTKNGQNIHNRNNPYKDTNTILTVVSSEANSNIIVVDSYPEWETGCFLALNAKEDMSDFPNFNFVDGKITEVRKIDDTHTEIIFDKPIKSKLKTGTKARIHSKHGSTYLYTDKKRLDPGEEVTFSSTIKKDEEYIQYGTKAFSRGTYYVIPIILSYSVNKEKDNKIIISDFTVSY
jgi:hypothetical protein